MSNYGGKNRELDEVEELLRATEDSMMLKLNVNTHHTSRSSSSSFTTSSSSSPLDDELMRRFEALKKPSVSNKITTVPSRLEEKKGDSAADAFARFSALKGGGEVNVNNVVEEEDEVEKLIQWAVDAARLDSSLTDDELEDSDEEEDSSSDLDEDEDEEDVRKKQSKEKKKKTEKPKK